MTGSFLETSTSIQAYAQPRFGFAETGRSELGWILARFPSPLVLFAALLSQHALTGTTTLGILARQAFRVSSTPAAIVPGSPVTTTGGDPPEG